MSQSENIGRAIWFIDAIYGAALLESKHETGKKDYKYAEKLLKSIIKDPPLNILGKVSKKHSKYDSFGWKYFTNPNEIHARMMEVRIYLNKKPGDIVTIDELNSILPSDSNNAFNKMFKYVNKDDFIDVMNKIRGVAIPIGLTGAITTGLNKNNKE